MNAVQPLQNHKCIVVGITGGIAAFKICSLVSSLKKQGYEVIVLMTKDAEQFVTPLTLQTLSGQKVITDMFTKDFTPDVHHISIAKKADAFVIAPATANIIAKGGTRNHAVFTNARLRRFVFADRRMGVRGSYKRPPGQNGQATDAPRETRGQS